MSRPDTPRLVITRRSMRPTSVRASAAMIVDSSRIVNVPVFQLS